MAMAAVRRRQARSTTCTCGRSRRASRRWPRTSWSIARPTATRPGASSRGCSQSRFGLDHTTLQVDHEGGELLQIETAPARRDRRRMIRARRRLRALRRARAPRRRARSGRILRRRTGRRTFHATSSSGRSPARCARPLRPRRRAGRLRPGGHRLGHVRLDRRRLRRSSRHRGRGLGVWMVETLLDAPRLQGLRRGDARDPRRARALRAVRLRARRRAAAWR